MTCGCTPPTRTSLWTPTPELRQPTDILPGENIDCFARRAGDPTGLQDDAQDDLVNRIQNTKISVDANMAVNETFTLSQGPRTATAWTMSPSVTGLTLSSGGALTGTIPDSEGGKTFQVTVSASDGSGEIDSRAFTFVPSKPSKGETIKLGIPYRSTNGQTPRVNSGFGPRLHPITRQMKLHKGQDWVGGGKGDILAAADGEVCFAGNSGGYGNLVRINHKSADGKTICQTAYGHMSQILVTQGQKVGQGQCIGKEGSTGASTGNHLHFEVLLGGTQPVDPSSYIGGTYQEQPPRQADGTVPSPKTVNNPNAVMSIKETEARTGQCPERVGAADAVGTEPADAPEIPDPTPTQEQAQLGMEDALSESSLTDDEKKFLRFVAQIESNMNPAAKNPTSSATGLFQMIDKTAVKYYGNIGIPATQANRTNPYYATKAMISFYTAEIKPYWEGYVASGRTTIAGKPIVSTQHSARYLNNSACTHGEFCYGLIHHDGVGNAVRGVDMQGIDYWRRKVRA